MIEFPERFLDRIHFEPNTGCWLWMGHRDRDGYGFYGPSHRRHVRAHRFAFEATRGPIADGLTLDHLCRMRCCVNPSHLEPVTQATNVLRGQSFAATNARTLSCKQGHPFDEHNTYRWRNKRRCRTCKRAQDSRTATERKRDYRARLRARDHLRTLETPEVPS